MTKLRVAIFGILVATAIVALVVLREQFQARIREKDEALQRQTERIAQLEGENERLSNLVLHATNGAAPTSDASRELLRLRGEVGALRQQTNELGTLRSDNARLSQAAASETNQLPAEDQFLIRQTHAVDAMNALLQSVKKYSTNHDGLYPRALDELKTSGDLTATNLAGDLGFNDFEFGQSAGVDPQGNRVLLRLRAPIPKPGGGAVMVVGGIDGASVAYTSVWTVSGK